jgi:type I restriction enzyme, S subunit
MVEKLHIKIGQLPETWLVTEFDNFTTLKRGKDLTRANFKPGVVPVAGSNGIIGYHDTFNVSSPGVTVGRSGSVGKVTYYNQDFWAHNTSLYVTDFHQNDPKFSAYYLYFLDLRRFRSGASVPTLDRNVFKKIALAIPLLPEQKKIAYVLSTVQRAIEQQERIIQLTTELKNALAHKLFTEGLNGETQKQTEIGPVPQSWKVTQLKETGEVIYGIQASVASNIKPIGTKILTNKNITLEGGFGLQQINYFKIKTEKQKATILQKGDLLFNWRSGSRQHVGKTAYFDLNGEYTHSSFILRIRPNEKANGRFLYYYLNWLRESGYFVKLQTYSINAKFNKSAVNSLPTILPDRDEQNKIAEAIDSFFKKIEHHRYKRTLLKELFRALLYQLMTAQIRVHDIDFEALENLTQKE